MESVRTDGLLLVDKPVGPTSHDVVARARRALRVKRIGHAGTLDPFASGLLVLLVGRATRLLPFVDGEPKVYEATIRFGAETETEDHTGAVTRSAPPPSRAAVLDALPRLTGDLEQLPPAYSAKKVGGVRAHEAARRGETLELRPAAVRVHRWVVREWREGPDPAECDVEVTCGGGTYVRSLARDLGRLSGSAAHLAALRRVRAGRFDVAEAVALDGLDREVGLRPALSALPDFPRVVVDDAGITRVARGMVVPGEGHGSRAAIVDERGELLAVAEPGRGGWQPRVVLVDA